MNSTSTSSDMTQPRGPDEVRDSLLRAAVESYTRGGPFSVREVARRAGVNHGQIHHLFGGKDGLFRAMIERLGALNEERVAAASDVGDLAGTIAAAARIQLEDRRLVRVLARRIVESPADQIPQQRFPVVERVEAALEAAGLGDKRGALAEGLALTLGWALFGDWIQRAVGLAPEEAEDLEEQLVQRSITLTDR